MRPARRRPAAATSPLSTRHVPIPIERQRGDNEEVRRDREDAARLADASQVPDHQQRDESERQLHAVDVPVGECRCERRDARRDADRHRQDVVDQQRAGGDERRHFAEVVLRDDVRAAARRVRVDRLAIGEDHDRQNRCDHERDRAREAERRGADEHQHAEDFLGRVRDRRQRVGRQHGQPGDAGEPFVVREVGRDRFPDDESLERGEEWLLRPRCPSNGRRG